MNRKKWPKPVKEFNVPLYGGRVYLYTNRETWDAARAYLGVTAIDEPLQGHFTRATQANGAVLYMLGWFNGKPSTLVHEAVHLVFSVFNRAGIPTNHDTDEAMTYFLDSVLESLGLDSGWKPECTCSPPSNTSPLSPY